MKRLVDSFATKLVGRHGQRLFSSPRLLSWQCSVSVWQSSSSFAPLKRRSYGIGSKAEHGFPPFSPNEKANAANSNVTGWPDGWVGLWLAATGLGRRKRIRAGWWRMRSNGPNWSNAVDPDAAEREYEEWADWSDCSTGRALLRSRSPILAWEEPRVAPISWQIWWRVRKWLVDAVLTDTLLSAQDDLAIRKQCV